jgi:hypothetical protein
MKKFILAAAAIALTAGTAMAAPAHNAHNKGYGHAKRVVVKRHKVGRLTLWERIKIAKSRARLAALQHRVRADGRVTRREKIRVRFAQKRHRALVRKERRD